MRLLSEIESDRHLVITIGGCKITKGFIVEVFDEDLGFVKIEVEEGYYTYRILDFRGWRPTQIMFYYENEEYDIHEEGWLDIGGFFNSDYFELKRVCTVEAIDLNNKITAYIKKDVTFEEAEECYNDCIKKAKPIEGMPVNINLLIAGEVFDQYNLIHESDKKIRTPDTDFKPGYEELKEMMCLAMRYLEVK